MACDNCPSGVQSGDTTLQEYDIPNNSGNDVTNIPIKQGAPMSTSCQRANTIGSIPEVIRHPAFTTIDGGVAAVKVSNGGISLGAMGSFFNRRNKECFDDIPLQGSTCA